MYPLRVAYAGWHGCQPGQAQNRLVFHRHWNYLFTDVINCLTHSHVPTTAGEGQVDMPAGAYVRQ